MVNFFKRYIFISIFALGCISLIPAVASAENAINTSICKSFYDAQKNLDPGEKKANPPAGCEGQNPGGQLLDKVQGDPSGAGYIKTLLNGFIYAAGIVCLIFLLLGSIRYLTSSGNSARIQQAKDTVLYSIIGLVIVALAIPISDYVIGIFRQP